MRKDNEQTTLIVVIIVVLVLFLFGGFGMGGMMGFPYWGMMGFGWIFMILVIVALTLFIVWLIKQIQKNGK